MIYVQQDFLDRVERRNETIRQKGGREINPERVVTDLEQAISEMGFDIGRIGTVLDKLHEQQEVSQFSNLHARLILNFSELLVRQQALNQESGYEELERSLAHAIEAAREKEIFTVGLCGSGGKIQTEADRCLSIPSSCTPRIQECHIMVGHILCEIIENQLFPRL